MDAFVICSPMRPAGYSTHPGSLGLDFLDNHMRIKLHLFVKISVALTLCVRKYELLPVFNDCGCQETDRQRVCRHSNGIQTGITV